MTPRRIQRKRTKGWRMPDGTIYVGRPSQWGNPYKADDMPPPGSDNIFDGDETVHQLRKRNAARAVDAFLCRLATLPEFRRDIIRQALRGHDLACWCRLCDVHADGKPLGVDCPDCAPCHADVLLEIANP